MPIRRREFLNRVAVTAGLALAGCRARGAGGAGDAGPDPADKWTAFRRQFALSEDYVHLSALLIASHPAPVRDAIEQYRREIDANPLMTLQEHNRGRQRDARAAAARYLGVETDGVALTDSTTMGVALVYNGLRLARGDEILTTAQDYYVTHESVRHAAARAGAVVRQVPLYERIDDVSAESLVDTVRRAIRPATRALALTWVHSSTGLKLPLDALGAAIGEVNQGRGPDRQVLLCIDGVHGFGIEDVSLAGLGIDFFAAGCHKWLFGPRGTGILWGSSRGWAATRPVIPSFTDDAAWAAWLAGEEPNGPVTALRMTPGGFKAFEHQWALPAAFEMHHALGKAEVQRRTHELATQLKEGLLAMPHVRLVTPMAPALSAGIVSFDVDGLDPWEAAKRLREARIVASVTPYAVRHVRLTPSIRNTPDDIDSALRAIHALG